MSRSDGDSPNLGDTSQTIRLEEEEEEFPSPGTTGFRHQLHSHTLGNTTDQTWVSWSEKAEACRRLNLSKAVSAPLLCAAQAPHHTQTSWQSRDETTSTFGSTASRRWGPRRPLGSSWRDCDMGGTAPARSNVDDGREFVQGCIPHWGRDNRVRLAGAVAHELSWAYRRMGRHVGHPLRKEGDILGVEDKKHAGDFRFGKKSAFIFWTDLRPPFSVAKLDRAEPQEALPHPDGVLYKVHYSCPIDYINERLFGEKSENGSFNNKVNGVASVRIPEGFPKRRPLHILSWGRPEFSANSTGDAQEGDKAEVPPERWMPIADELGIRADSPRLAACRAATTRLPKANAKGIRVAPLQKLLLGPHASLPRLAEVSSRADGALAAGPGGPRTPKKKQRQHRIYSACAGFVTFAG